MTLDGLSFTIDKLQLLLKSYPRETFIPTYASEVASTAMQAYLSLPYAAFAHQSHHTSLINLIGNYQQSVSIVFRAGGWAYNIGDDVQRTIMAQIGNSSNVFNVYIIDGYLCVDTMDGNIGYFDCSAWAYQSWHAITICCQYDLVGNSDTQSWKMYVDFDTAHPIALSQSGFYPLIGRPDSGASKTECHFILGANMDVDLTTQYNEFDGYVSEFFIGPVAFDKIQNGRSKSVIDIIKQAYSTSGEYNINNFVLKNDDLALFVQGNALFGYAARTIHFQANPSNDTMSPITASAYVYPEDQTHYKMIGILGKTIGRDLPYFASEAENGYSNNQKLFSFKQWTRMYVENQVAENSENVGLRRIFGCAVPIGSTFYFDGIQIENLHASTSYCAGDQTNCSWTGTPNASTSSRNNQYARLLFPAQLANLYDKDWTVMFRFQMPDLSFNNASRVSSGEGYESIIYIGEGGASSTIGVRYLKSHMGAQIDITSKIYITLTDESGNSVWVYGQQYAGSGEVNAKLIRDSFFTLSVVYDNTAKVFYFYLNGIQVAYSASMANRHFKIPAYIYFGSTGPLNPAPLYSSMKIDQAIIFGSVIQPYHIMQITTAMQDPDFIPPAAFQILNFYDFNLGSLEATIGNSVNEDVKRTRNRVFWANMNERGHLQNLANKYNLKLQFQEV